MLPVCSNKYEFSVIEHFVLLKMNIWGPLIGALEFEGLENFTVKYLLNPKITFTVTNEKGSMLNRQDAETSWGSN